MSSPRPSEGWPARLAIARRDLLEFVRDRRALFITLVMPMAMYPLLALSSTIGVRTAILELDRRQETRRLSLLLSGPDAVRLAACIGRIAERPERPPDWPDALSVHLVDADSARPLLDEGAADVWIDVPAGSVAVLAGDGTLALEARLSTVRPPGRRGRETALAVMRGIADDARLARLARAGLPASLVDPLRIEFSGDVTPGAAAARDILPAATAAVLVLLALLTATGAFYPAIDAIAGEKERGTIETLLISPCTMLDLVTGKFLAVYVVTLATLAANAVSITLTASVFGSFVTGGIAAPPRAATVAACGVLTLVAYAGLAAVAAALCLAVTAAAKTAKEAQNTLTPVVMLIAALSASALLPAAGGRGWLTVVPFAGHVAVAMSLLETFGLGAENGPQPPEAAGGLAWSGIALVLSGISSLVVTRLLLGLTAHVVADEEILFRGPEEATQGFRRPPPRGVPTGWQGVACLAAGFAALWYAQGLAPPDLVPALVVQQAAVILPTLAIAWWQRVDARVTFGLRLPGRDPPRAVAATVAAALLGAGTFVVGAAAALAAWRGAVSPEARRLADELVLLIRGIPAPVAVLLLAVMPAACEELLFRGWVLAALAGERPTRRRAVLAVVGQAAAFAAFHLLPERMPQTFLLGLVLGWLVRATGSLLPAIVAHATHNAMPVLLVATASAADLLATPEQPVGRLLPSWSVAAAVACLVGGAVLVALARSGATEDDAWTRAVEAPGDRA